MWLWSPLGWLGVLATLWCVYFFRDPPRVTPLREGLVISPADGRVSRIANAVPPPELALGDRPVVRISIFMSVFDCHVNRSPVAGRIERIAYRAGLFLNADLDKASEDNERNCFLIRTARRRPGRRRPDRRPRRAAHRVVRARGDGGRRRRAHRHDPVRLAARRLSPRRRPPAGRRRPDRDRRGDHHRRPLRRRPRTQLPRRVGRRTRVHPSPSSGRAGWGLAFLLPCPRRDSERAPPKPPRRRGGRETWCGRARAYRLSP